jgi:hypothetical protein
VSTEEAAAEKRLLKLTSDRATHNERHDALKEKLARLEEKLPSQQREEENKRQKAHEPSARPLLPLLTPKELVDKIRAEIPVGNLWLANRIHAAIGV